MTARPFGTFRRARKSVARATAVLAMPLIVGGALLASQAPAGAYYTSVEVDAIYAHFPAHEAPTALAIAECESGLGADIYNEYSGAYGMFQFLPSTSVGMGFDHAAMADPYYSAWAAARLQDSYGWGQWACAY